MKKKLSQVKKKSYLKQRCFSHLLMFSKSFSERSMAQDELGNQAVEDASEEILPLGDGGQNALG